MEWDCACEDMPLRSHQQCGFHFKRNQRCGQGVRVPNFGMFKLSDKASGQFFDNSQSRDVVGRVCGNFRRLPVQVAIDRIQGNGLPQLEDLTPKLGEIDLEWNMDSDAEISRLT